MLGWYTPSNNYHNNKKQNCLIQKILMVVCVLKQTERSLLCTFKITILRKFNNAGMCKISNHERTNWNTKNFTERKLPRAVWRYLYVEKSIMQIHIQNSNHERTNWTTRKKLHNCVQWRNLYVGNSKIKAHVKNSNCQRPNLKQQKCFTHLK